MDIAKLDAWYSQSQRRAAVSLLMKRVGVTRTRAECFVRLWIYLSVKQLQESQPHLKPPLAKLELLPTEVQCTHREAAELFYSDSDRGSDYETHDSANSCYSEEFIRNIPLFWMSC